jgi:hypothetical protein
MSREILTLVVPLLLPTVLYLLWLRASRWADEGAAVAWCSLPWAWLALIGAALTAVVLIVVTVGFGTEKAGTYVPPRAEGARIVPGHIEPAEPAKP